MNGWVIAAVAVGLVSVGILGFTLVKLARALKAVQRGLDELANVVPAARRVSGGFGPGRSSMGQFRNN
ncbi:MAG: hypothetical protein ACT4OS_07795 [Acidimicrobiales bacterium]